MYRYVSQPGPSEGLFGTLGVNIGVVFFTSEIFLRGFVPLITWSQPVPEYIANSVV